MGVMADRVDRKHLMVVADLARAVLCVGFLLRRTQSRCGSSSLARGHGLFQRCVRAGVGGGASQPGRMQDDLATANALSGSLWGTMLTVGAALGAWSPRSWPRCGVPDQRGFVRGVRCLATEHPTVVPGGAGYTRGDPKRSARPPSRRSTTPGVTTASWHSLPSSSDGVWRAVSSYWSRSWRWGSSMPARSGSDCCSPHAASARSSGRSWAGPPGARTEGSFPRSASRSRCSGRATCSWVAPTLLVAPGGHARPHRWGAQWMLSSYGLQRCSRPHPRSHLRVRRDARDAHVRHLSLIDRLALGVFDPRSRPS